MTPNLTVSPHSYAKILHHAYKYPTTHIFGLLIGDTTTSPPRVLDAIPIAHHHSSAELMLPIYQIMIPFIEKAMRHRFSHNEPSIVGLYYADYYVDNNVNDEDDNELKNPEDDSLSMSHLPKPLQLLLTKLAQRRTDPEAPLYTWLLNSSKLAHATTTAATTTDSDQSSTTGEQPVKKTIALQQFVSTSAAKNWSTEWNHDMDFSADTYRWSFELDPLRKKAMEKDSSLSQQGEEEEPFSEHYICQRVAHYIEVDPAYRFLVDLQEHVDDVSKDWRNLDYEKRIKF